MVDFKFVGEETNEQEIDDGQNDFKFVGEEDIKSEEPIEPQVEEKKN